ncbi:hypothetical protein ALC57_18395, partial [Trachymyrmex cornetzi]
VATCAKFKRIDSMMAGVNFEISKKVYTCGMCETILDEGDVNVHECFVNYPSLFCDKNTLYLYPQCGECSADEVKKKWKNLRDRYMKIISLEKLPSGSASKPSRRKWQYYNSMSFLRDTFLKKETVSNITNLDEDLNNDKVAAQVEREDDDTVDASRGMFCS